ncbi:hypothetical protein COO91_03306 [Nostoc flagelliforme CCNUN1]|uniref:Uncharacterized protein n=1 Tax=Nostoc flagelliforme CCNUN1 TaxID=2038116 RepID=A0A2K8SPK3_9NOSO|nr:hypothetical protein COO91_03306 [Nostoc flagelliforme CCNUN1]
MLLHPKENYIKKAPSISTRGERYNTISLYVCRRCPCDRLYL